MASWVGSIVFDVVLYRLFSQRNLIPTKGSYEYWARNLISKYDENMSNEYVHVIELMYLNRYIFINTLSSYPFEVWNSKREFKIKGLQIHHKTIVVITCDDLYLWVNCHFWHTSTLVTQESLLNVTFKGSICFDNNHSILSLLVCQICLSFCAYAKEGGNWYALLLFSDSSEIFFP